jgi:hypothetical protein
MKRTHPTVLPRKLRRLSTVPLVVLLLTSAGLAGATDDPDTGPVIPVDSGESDDSGHSGTGSETSKTDRSKSVRWVEADSPTRVSSSVRVTSQHDSDGDASRHVSESSTSTSVSIRNTGSSTSVVHSSSVRTADDGRSHAIASVSRAIDVDQTSDVPRRDARPAAGPVVLGHSTEANEEIRDGGDDGDDTHQSRIVTDSRESVSPVASSLRRSEDEHSCTKRAVSVASMSHVHTHVGSLSLPYLSSEQVWRLHLEIHSDCVGDANREHTAIHEPQVVSPRLPVMQEYL